MSIKKCLFIMYSILVCTLIMFGITACQTTPQPIVVTKVVSVYKGIPGALITNCVAPAPIPIPEYLKLSCAGKEDFLTKYTNSLLTQINQCNNTINEIRLFDVNNQKLFPPDFN